VTGLVGSGLVLKNSSGDDKAISTSGAFTFATAIASGTGYNVTVQTQPSSPSQTCTVNHGIGTVFGANVTNVMVNCSYANFAYVANKGDNSVSIFAVNAAGRLTSWGSVGTGTQPNSVTVDPSNKFVYVANYGSNNVSAFEINPSTGALTAITGSPFSAGNNPVSITVDPTGMFAYVANFGDNTVSAYTINASTGALTAVGAIAAGTNPASVTVDPTGWFAYVANYGSNNVSAYTINAITGALTAVSDSPYASGTGPQDVAVDPTGRYAYVANINSSNVSAYIIDAATGALDAISGSPYAAGTNPAFVVIGPTGEAAYVANYGGGNVSSYIIDPSTGVLTVPEIVSARNGSISIAISKGYTPAPPFLKSCKDLSALSPSGVYTIYPDGFGGIGAFQVYCDMVNDGGGWTLIAQGGHTTCSSMAQKEQMTDTDTCSYLSYAKVKALAGVSTTVRLQVNETANTFGSWTSTALSTNTKAIEGLLTPTGTWHNGTTWDNWCWIWTCSPYLATGWPNVFQSCGQGCVHWVLNSYLHDKVPGPGGMSKRSATWVK
jgi:6-phosphogluconolactonase (cycloisomerase 2 family)